MALLVHAKIENVVLRIMQSFIPAVCKTTEEILITVRFASETRELQPWKHQSITKSYLSLYSLYYAEACYGFTGSMLRFKSLANQIGNSDANGSPPLRHFFKRGSVARWRKGPEIAPIDY